MADTSPPTPPPPPQPKPGSPIVDPAALVATFFSVIRGPGDFFKSAKEEKGLQKCVTFSVASWLVFGVLMLLVRILYGHGFGAGVRELVQDVIFGFLGPFIDGLIIWIVCLILGSKAPYERTDRLLRLGGDAHRRGVHAREMGRLAGRRRRLRVRPLHRRDGGEDLELRAPSPSDPATHPGASPSLEPPPGKQGGEDPHRR